MKVLLCFPHQLAFTIIIAFLTQNNSHNLLIKQLWKTLYHHIQEYCITALVHVHHFVYSLY